jgi:hypothetical protein
LASHSATSILCSFGRSPRDDWRPLAIDDERMHRGYKSGRMVGAGTRSGMLTHSGTGSSNSQVRSSVNSPARTRSGSAMSLPTRPMERMAASLPKASRMSFRSSTPTGLAGAFAREPSAGPLAASEVGDSEERPPVVGGTMVERLGHLRVGSTSLSKLSAAQRAASRRRAAKTRCHACVSARPSLPAACAGAEIVVRRTTSLQLMPSMAACRSMAARSSGLQRKAIAEVSASVFRILMVVSV